MSKLTALSSLLIASPFWMASGDAEGPLAPRIVPRQQVAGAIRVDVNMTLVPVSVTDPQGRSVTGLGPENFHVFDGTRPVSIVSFGSEDQPITVGLIFDCSGSMKDKFKIARQAPRESFRHLNPDDQSFLITVSTKPELKQPLTSDFDEIQDALVFTHPVGTTSLLDGVYIGLQHIRKSHNPHKALILVSDGGDNESRYTLNELESIAAKSDTQIFAMGLYENPKTPEEAYGPELLSRLCARTGGLNFVVVDLAELRVGMGKVGVALHNQYVLGYYPPDDSRASGKYRKIEVKLLVPAGLPNLQFHARAGYYTPGR